MRIPNYRPLTLAIIILSFTTIAVTWPLAWHLTDRVPVGTEQELTVPLFNLWTLWWNATQAMNGFPGYWDAPIFHPTIGTFSFSEPQLLTGLIGAPMWWMADSAATVYNLTLLFCLFLNGLFAFRLAKSLHIPFAPSLICGMLMIGMPITTKLLGGLPLIPIFGIVWALEGFIRFGREGSIQHAIWAGLGIIVQFFLSQQLTLLFAPFALLAGVISLHQRDFEQRSLLTLGGVGLCALSLCVWFAWNPLQVHQSQGFTRTDQVVQALSAHPEDYLTKPSSSLLNFPSREAIEQDTGGLFPGFCILILSGWGMTFGLRETSHRRWVTYFLLVGSLSVFLSFGLNLSIGGWHPFNILRSLVPGFHEFRSPFRFAILVQMSLCLLSAFGLWKILQSGSPLKKISLISTIALLAILENSAIPQPLQSFPTIERQDWVGWLRQQDTRRVIIHVPLPKGQHVSDYEIETVRMLAQFQHRKRLANGYSGYFPPGYSNFQIDMDKNFPSNQLLCFLIQELKVDTVVIDKPWALEHNNMLQEFSPFTHTSYEDEDVQIFLLPKTYLRC